MASTDVAYSRIETRDQVVPRWTVPQRATAVASLIFTVGLAGYSVATVASKHQGKNESDRTTDGLVKFLGSNGTTSLSVMALEQSCYGFTGGTCLTSSCLDGRNSVCGSNAQCICPPGKCTGADGACYPGVYIKVASAVSFTNAYWSSSWLYMQSVSVLSQLSTSGAPEASFGGSQLFDVYELPGTPSGRKEYFLASNKWTTWVASIRSTGGPLSLSMNPWGLFGLNLDHSVAPWDPQKLIVHLCTLKNKVATPYPDSIMIGSPGLMGNPVWAYIHRGSSLVYGWFASGDPSSGGYWTPSVPIGGLQDC